MVALAVRRLMVMFAIIVLMVAMCATRCQSLNRLNQLVAGVWCGKHDIYKEREREREKGRDIDMQYIYIYIYVYIHSAHGRVVRKA